MDFVHASRVIRRLLRAVFVTVRIGNYRFGVGAAGWMGQSTLSSR
jgi:hypothetical protein